jgi:3-oxoacyl-(acyl-carrier-protein) synthase
MNGRPSRVFVTGMGVLSAYGPGREAFEKGLFSARSGIRRIEGIDTDALNCHYGAQIDGFSGEDLIRKSERQFHDRVSLMAMAAADEALRHAGLDYREIAAVTGAMMGSAFGPGEAIQDSVLRIARKERLRPTSIVKMMLNAPAAALCLRYGLQGASAAHTAACAASAHAIAQGTRAVRDGDMEICLVGGAEAFPSSALFAAWDALSVMTPETDVTHGVMRPFCQDRKGFVIGEGAAVLVLENEERALARGAPILAEICGSGVVSDTPTLTRPSLRGMTGAMRAAIKDAGIVAADVAHINTHGTATELNDALERGAIEDLFGETDGIVAITASKAAIGHCMGAASALEAAATILALQRQEAPWPVQFGTDASAERGPDRGKPSAMRAQYALSNSFAFGGHYASIAFKRIDDAP